MEKYRDLFTEKDTTQMSLFHKDVIPSYKKKINRDLYDKFYGPVKNIESDYLNTLNVVEKQSKLGKDHILYKNFQNLYGNSLSSNIVLPHLDIASLTLTDLILVSDPDDCERLAQKHIKKMPNFKLLLHDSLISTTDNKHWRNQRLEYVNSFSTL